MTQPHILIHEMSFKLPTNIALFTKLNLSITKQKVGLIGKNGVGKSTLIKLITGELQPTSGSIQVNGSIDYMQQLPEYLTETTIADVLGFQTKYEALLRIKQGSCDPTDYAVINDDWLVVEKMQSQLAMFGLSAFHPSTNINSLSSGQLSKLFLTRILQTKADFLLLDEPTNHLDFESRMKLYDVISKCQCGLIVVSHDRKLLNLMDSIHEVTTLGVNVYGGNYDAYRLQKNVADEALTRELMDAKRLLNKTQQSIQSTKEKHEQRQAKGRDMRKRGDQPKMLLDAMKDRSTAEQGALLIRHDRMYADAIDRLQQAKSQLEIVDKLNIKLDESYVPNTKIILEMQNVTYSYQNTTSNIISHFDLTVRGAERIALVGENGSGKTTLIKLILRELVPNSGQIYLGTDHVNYLDQTVHQLNPELSLLRNYQLLNQECSENEAYKALAQFMFKNVAATKLVKDLSGGERLRGMLACVLKSLNPPKLLILDEPTNHLDLECLENIEAAIKLYRGALIVISHDQAFLEAINIERMIYAPFTNNN